ncbi:MAG: hypothetical protein E7Z78_02025 [Methanobrevibacter thaueri]|jgi:regulator of replication initiation timing|uniref:hypothetical protein n=1 Tax=Methanobrevibacter thaueri TaxID=190975 RepID=UPI0026ECEDB6|nr:hypothetical protein [Methanobrevibacter thaueri]MBE6495198.1 hypothetical protein [Methanobrevibacter thaueri]
MASKIPHVNDRTLKYSSMALCRRQHEYLGLPGEYESRYPNEVVFPNMESGRVDEFYSIKEGILINLEEESGKVSDKTLKKISRYRTFGNFVYSKPVYTAIICHKDPKNFPKEYEITKTDILRPDYIYFPQDELWAKYENLINKIEQKEKLSEREILDIAFVPKYISKKDAPFMTENLARRFKDAKIEDKRLRIDVGSILGAMIKRNVEDETKQNKLMEMIGMNQIKNDIRAVFKDEFMEIEEENLKLKLERDNLKNKLQELNSMDDLNTPQAKELINSLILLL